MATTCQSWPANPDDTVLADVAEPHAATATDIRKKDTPRSARNRALGPAGTVWLRRAALSKVADRLSWPSRVKRRAGGTSLGGSHAGTSSINVLDAMAEPEVPACWRPTAAAGPSSGSTAAGPRSAAWQRPTWHCTGSPARRPRWRAARPAHDRRATRGRGTADLRVPRCVQRPLHGRRGAARRRPESPCPTRIWRGSSTTTP